MATRIKGKSEKEHEGHSDDNGTVSFLRLPFLILGDGGAVECGVLHDDTFVDNNKYSVLYFVSFVLLTFNQNIFYVTIVCFCTIMRFFSSRNFIASLLHGFF